MFTFDSVLIATNDTNRMFNPPSFQFISVHKMLWCLVESWKKNRFPMIQLIQIYSGRLLKEGNSNTANLSAYLKSHGNIRACVFLSCFSSENIMLMWGTMKLCIQKHQTTDRSAEKKFCDRKYLFKSYLHLHKGSGKKVKCFSKWKTKT